LAFKIDDESVAETKKIFSLSVLMLDQNRLATGLMRCCFKRNINFQDGLFDVTAIKPTIMAPVVHDDAGVVVVLVELVVVDRKD
jgi:hypothetical protein